MPVLVAGAAATFVGAERGFILLVDTTSGKVWGQAVRNIDKQALVGTLSAGPLADAYDFAAGVMVENMMHAESEEGIGAFIEKRTPVWDKG